MKQTIITTFKGVNSGVAPHLIAAGEQSSAKNMVAPLGELAKRPGFAKVPGVAYDAADFSAWPNLLYSFEPSTANTDVPIPSTEDDESATTPETADGSTGTTGSVTIPMPSTSSGNGFIRGGTPGRHPESLSDKTKDSPTFILTSPATVWADVPFTLAAATAMNAFTGQGAVLGVSTANHVPLYWTGSSISTGWHDGAWSGTMRITSRRRTYGTAVFRIGLNGKTNSAASVQAIYRVADMIPTFSAGDLIPGTWHGFTITCTNPTTAETITGYTGAGGGVTVKWTVIQNDDTRISVSPATRNLAWSAGVLTGEVLIPVYAGNLELSVTYAESSKTTSRDLPDLTITANSTGAAGIGLEMSLTLAATYNSIPAASYTPPANAVWKWQYYHNDAWHDAAPGDFTASDPATGWTNGAWTGTVAIILASCPEATRIRADLMSGESVLSVLPQRILSELVYTMTIPETVDSLFPSTLSMAATIGGTPANPNLPATSVIQWKHLVSGTWQALSSGITSLDPLTGWSSGTWSNNFTYSPSTRGTKLRAELVDGLGNTLATSNEAALDALLNAITERRLAAGYSPADVSAGLYDATLNPGGNTLDTLKGLVNVISPSYLSSNTWNGSTDPAFLANTYADTSSTFSNLLTLVKAMLKSCIQPQFHSNGTYSRSENSTTVNGTNNSATCTAQSTYSSASGTYYSNLYNYQSGTIFFDKSVYTISNPVTGLASVWAKCARQWYSPSFTTVQGQPGTFSGVLNGITLTTENAYVRAISDVSVNSNAGEYDLGNLSPTFITGAGSNPPVGFTVTASTIIITWAFSIQ